MNWSCSEATIAAASFPAMFDLISSPRMNIRSLVGQELTLQDGAGCWSVQ